ncbi:MAG: HD domain-containing protein, partial [Cytophagaceae bacterium]
MINSPEGQHILDRLKNELPGHFHYHNADHTIDVYNAAKAISEKEGIDPEDARLLLVAALYHDSGYLNRVKEHERASCDIVRETLPEFGYT